MVRWEPGGIHSKVGSHGPEGIHASVGRPGGIHASVGRPGGIHASMGRPGGIHAGMGRCLPEGIHLKVEQKCCGFVVWKLHARVFTREKVMGFCELGIGVTVF